LARTTRAAPLRRQAECPPGPPSPTLPPHPTAPPRRAALAIRIPDTQTLDALNGISEQSSLGPGLIMSRTGARARSL